MLAFASQHFRPSSAVVCSCMCVSDSFSPCASSSKKLASSSMAPSKAAVLMLLLLPLQSYFEVTQPALEKSGSFSITKLAWKEVEQTEQKLGVGDQ